MTIFCSGARLYFEYCPVFAKFLDSNSNGDFEDNVYVDTLGLMSIKFVNLILPYDGMSSLKELSG